MKLSSRVLVIFLVGLDYPMCLLPPDVRDLLLETISGSSAATLEAFLEYCIDSILGDLTKGDS